MATIYQNDIPQSDDFLSDSQQDILNNFSQLDTTFGIDHYTYSDATANNGFHNQVTTPLIVGSAHPTTAADVPKFYAMQDSVNLGVIQYSRGPSDAVPTPVTFLQSSSAAISIVSGNTIDLLDFTGITRANFNLFIVGDSATLPTNRLLQYFYNFESGTFRRLLIGTTSSANGPVATNTGSILQILASGANVSNLYWTIQFLRIT